MEKIITIKEISKTYDGIKVVDNLSFDLEKGHILAFLGPNGAGKSTTINMISALVEQDQGSIIYKGKDVKDCKRQFKREIGVVPQSLAIYEDLTAYQNLKFLTSLYGIAKNDVDRVCNDALQFVGLESVKNKKAGTFSGGMKRRLNIACSLVNSPEVIILDEPTVGIDPQSRNFILDAIKKLRDQGVSVIYTTHYMEEIEAIAQDVIIIDHGKVLINDTLENIKRKYSEQSCVKVEVDVLKDEALAEISEINGVSIRHQEEMKMEFNVDFQQNVSGLNDIVNVFSKHGCNICSVNTMNMDLEDIFLQLTGTKLRD